MACAVIVAAGEGRRMGGGTRKQYLMLGGRPILERTLEVFDACPQIESITLVLPPSEAAEGRPKRPAARGFRKPIRATAGGDCRQRSVFNGLRHTPEPADGVVVVHDGVRPFASAALLHDCICAARRHGACTAAVPASDTLKQADRQGFVRRTLERDGVWMVQTPQAFEYRLLLGLHRAARNRPGHCTDDAQLVERTGHSVRVVPGSVLNIKITSPDDLKLAQAIWAAGVWRREAADP